MKTDIKSCGRIKFDEVTINRLRTALRDRYKVNEVNINDLNYGLKIEMIGSDCFNFIRDAVVKVCNVPSESLLEFERDANSKRYSLVYFPEKDNSLKRLLKKSK